MNWGDGHAALATLSTPRPTARFTPITNSGSSAVNTDRYTISRINAISPTVAIEISSRSCSAESIMSLNVVGGPVTDAVTDEPVNTFATMWRTACTGFRGGGIAQRAGHATGRYHALPSRLTAWVAVTGSASRFCTSKTWPVSARSRDTSCS